MFVLITDIWLASSPLCLFFEDTTSVLVVSADTAPFAGCCIDLLDAFLEYFVTIYQTKSVL